MKKALFLSSLFVILATLFSSGCATKVRPIDLYDDQVPIEGRRLVADAQDSIAIARSELDDALVNLETMRQWRLRIRNRRDWPSGASDAITRLQTMAEARLRLAQLETDRARANLTLAESKADLIIARVAVRHDIAVYDLGELNDRADRDLDRLRAINRQIAIHMETLDQATRSWWSAYSTFVGSGGDGQLFFAAFQLE